MNTRHELRDKVIEFLNFEYNPLEHNKPKWYTIREIWRGVMTKHPLSSCINSMNTCIVNMLKQKDPKIKERHTFNGKKMIRMVSLISENGKRKK